MPAEARTLLGAAFALAAALAATACGPSDAGETSFERITREGVVRVGYANEAPFAFLEPRTGRVTGEAPEVARAVFARLGIEEVQGVLTEFSSLIPGLQAGRFDLIAAGMYVTPVRCQEIAFSAPTYSLGGAFLVASDDPYGLHGYEDVAAHEAVRLGVIAGAVEGGWALATGVAAEQIVVFPDAPSGLAGLLAGRIDAFAVTELTAQDLQAKSADRRVSRAEPFRDPIIDGRPARGFGAFGLRREDEDLREAIDRELAALLGSPEHRALVAPFGFGPAQLPGETTPAELCAPTTAAPPGP